MTCTCIRLKFHLQNQNSRLYSNIFHRKYGLINAESHRPQVDVWSRLARTRANRSERSALRRSDLIIVMMYCISWSLGLSPSPGHIKEATNGLVSKLTEGGRGKIQTCPCGAASASIGDTDSDALPFV